MPTKLKCIQKMLKHFQHILNTFNFSESSLCINSLTNEIYVTVYADSSNPIGKLSVVGKYVITQDMFYIQAIGLCTHKENTFFNALNHLQKSLTALQLEIDNAN